MTESLPAISVVIPTLNRPEAVYHAVSDFLLQQYPIFEVIAVGPDVGENNKLKELAARDQRLKIILSDQSGTCHARNLGVKAASGDVVLFVDDDCRIPDPHFLSHHGAQYGDEKIGGVGGRVIDKNLKLDKPSSGPVCSVSKTGAISPNSLGTVRQFINAPRGGNMSFRRPIIAQVGGFDERFRGNAMREETDFSLRVVEAGWKIVFVPEAEDIHLALAGGTRTADRITWYQDFFFNETLFFLKHFPRRYLPLLLARKLRAIIACKVWYGKFRPRAVLAPWKAFHEAQAVARESQPRYI